MASNDIPNPQLVPAWDVQHGIGGEENLVLSAGTGPGGGPASLVAVPAAHQAAVAASTASTAAGVDTDLNGLITAFNALNTALVAAGLEAAS